ncbi:protein trichome birefringence-like [Magnolia sinica]|uniref:protein trichome birefringence-like n=1 Tax=Magnolia sinica TaxID=86752 RepID=UPI002659827B|nr:protein trichome birefringence-like [Magnolia sinica]
MDGIMIWFVIFLIFYPNDGSLPPWLDRIFTNSTSNSNSYISQFSSIYSYFFPINLTSIIYNSNSSKEKRSLETRVSNPAAKENCDIFNGRWVNDELYPEGSYLIDEQYNSFLNGWSERDYQKLHWQLNGCNIPSLYQIWRLSLSACPHIS